MLALRRTDIGINVLKEFELIKNIFQTSMMANTHGREDILLGIGDDCAQVQVPVGQSLVFSMDTFRVEGRHFPFDADPVDIGYRAVATLTVERDLAAMGAKPVFTLGLTIPESDPQWLAGLAQGMAGGRADWSDFGRWRYHQRAVNHHLASTWLSGSRSSAGAL